jgi:Kef-type K+ transport system membrane component KefB
VSESTWRVLSGLLLADLGIVVVLGVLVIAIGRRGAAKVSVKAVLGVALFAAVGLALLYLSAWLFATRFTPPLRG